MLCFVQEYQMLSGGLDITLRNFLGFLRYSMQKNNLTQKKSVKYTNILNP